MNTTPHGYFVISLDFELFWGMTDKETLASYGEHVRGEQTAIPHMLTIFESYGIHATWATVGMLMARNKQELLSLLPPVHMRPIYSDPRMSTYTYFETATIGESEEDDPYHFGNSLVRAVLDTPHQEIGNHTFSHYYCLDGETNKPEIFMRDLEAHRAIARTYGVETTSIIFPRNQTTEETLRVCGEMGLTAYRGNETHFLYKPRKDSEQKLWIRGLRLLDHYINISGHHTYPLPTKVTGLINIPASRFLRSWNTRLRFLEWLRIRRIKKSMTYAAKRGEVFHLWWHPHNFGMNHTENLRVLDTLLRHFVYLKERYGFASANMKDISEIVETQTTA